MADNGSTQSTGTQEWPLPSFYFKVSISNVGDISCSEVSGLETEYEEITYRAGDSPVFTKLKMPGLRKSGDLTIKKGIFKDDKALWEWVQPEVYRRREKGVEEPYRIKRKRKSGKSTLKFSAKMSASDTGNSLIAYTAFSSHRTKKNGL